MGRELDKKAIGSRIRRIRAGRTQKDFAQTMGATQAFISDLERGRCYPTVSFLARLAEVSGASYDWLLTGEGEAEAAEQPAEAEERPQAPAVAEMDTTYLKRLVEVLEEAPPAEKPRFIKIIVSYLVTYL